jgi:predicted molibdopterin-dependent oxidoreductase YjgC
MLAREGFIWIHSTEGYYHSRRKGSHILHQEGFPTPDDRAILAPVHFRPHAEDASPERPLILTTGRVVCHYNAWSMTFRSPSLLEIEPKLYVELHPCDVSERGIGDSEAVVVHTARGDARATVRINERVAPGVVFLPFHFSGRNVLTLDVRDPLAEIPELKVAACEVRKN